MPTEIQTLFLKGWEGGWQPDIAESNVPPNSIIDLQDVEWTEGRGLKKRGGYDVITNAVSGTAEITSVNRGTADGGTFTLTWSWPLSTSSVSGGTTSAIAYDASAADVKAAVEAMEIVPLSIDVSVTGTGTVGDPWLITMTDPIVGALVTGDGTNLTNGSLTVAESQKGLTALGPADGLSVKSVEVLEPGAYPRYTQIVFYLNEADGHVFYARLGDLIVEEDSGGGEDLARSGFSLGPWVWANAERPYSFQAVTWGRGIYITSQRVGGLSSDGNAINTHSGKADHHTQPLHYDADNDTWSTKEPHELNGTTTGFPTARCCIVAYDRVFAANLVKQEETGTDYRYRSRIHWSDAGTAETWDENSYIIVGAEDDGTDIVNLTKFREQIMIFKNDSVWTLTGTDEDTFVLYALSESRGCAGTYAAVADDTHVYFFDATEGVISYDGANFVNISEPVNDTMLAELNDAAAFKTVMWRDEDNVYVSIPNGTLSNLATDKPSVTYVFNTDLQVWTRWTYAPVGTPAQSLPDSTQTASNMDVFVNDWFGAFTDVSGLARLHTGSSDNGSAIDAYFESAWITPGDMGVKHRLRRLEILAEPDGDVVDVTLYRNFSRSSFKTGTFTPTGTLDGWHEQQDGYSGDFWTWLKLRFANDTDAETFEINGVGMAVSSRRLLRHDLGVT